MQLCLIHFKPRVSDHPKCENLVVAAYEKQTTGSTEKSFLTQLPSGWKLINLLHVIDQYRYIKNHALHQGLEE